MAVSMLCKSMFIIVDLRQLIVLSDNLLYSGSSILFLTSFPQQVPALLIYLFIWVLTSLSIHCIGHIMTGTWKGRGNQYIQLVKVLVL